MIFGPILPVAAPGPSPGANHTPAEVRACSCAWLWRLIEIGLSCTQGGVTPASDVFGGALRSEVRAQGAPPSATLEPCFLVHLDIHPETVHSVSDALSAFTSPETISVASSTVSRS